MDDQRSSALPITNDDSNFSIKFAGKDEIDAALLGASLTSLYEIINGISNEIEPGTVSKLFVRAPAKGSVILDLIVGFAGVVSIVNGFDEFQRKISQRAPSVVKVLKQIWGIKWHLNCKPAAIVKREGDELLVQNSAGQNSLFDAAAEIYFKDPKFDKFIVQFFSRPAIDPNIPHIEINCGQSEPLIIKHEDFHKMATPIYEENLVESQKEYVKTYILLKKPDFLGNSKWDFKYRTRTISATIQDKEWLAKVHSGVVKNFEANVSIPVEMLIEWDVDKNNRPILKTRRYTILKVTGDIVIPPKNGDLFK
ncbi:MAG: hypothetical protein Q7V63_09740 [Gammaproteobacteria bacterium]|nr:hypothetical protein [Gammaproteobacteria bacterium]